MMCESEDTFEAGEIETRTVPAGIACQAQITDNEMDSAGAGSS